MTLVALSEALGLGSDPDAVLHVLSTLYREVDRAIEEGAAGLGLPCEPGCDACCHEAVFVSAPEFLAVARDLIERRTVEERRDLVKKMRAIAADFEDELELLETIPPGEERDEVAARVKFRCPLLGADGRCTVYEARELNARTFGQAWDGARDQPYGCELTHRRLRVLQDPRAGLADAREVRRRLKARLSGTERVHVYPWWFARYGDLLLEEAAASSRPTD